MTIDTAPAPGPASALPTALREAVANATPLPTNRAVRIFGRQDPARTLIPGQIDDTAVAIYLTGQCHALAIALATMTGWPAAVLVEPECRFSPDDPACSEPDIEPGLCGCQLDHLVVVRPTDRALVDITGAHTGAIPGLEGHRLVPMTDALWNEVLTSPQWQHPDISLALAFAQTVLARLHHPLTVR